MDQSVTEDGEQQKENGDEESRKEIKPATRPPLLRHGYITALVSKT
jgi:hypothetical protein